MNFKIVKEEDFYTILGTIVTGNDIFKFKTLRVMAVSKKDVTKIRYGVINYRAGNRTKALKEIKQKLAIAFR